jgi:hypothetical protein
MAKNLPPAVFLRLLPYLLVTELVMLPYFLIRSPSSIEAFFAGWSAFLAQRGEVWKKRRRVRKSTVVSSDYVWSLFEEL